MRYEELLNIIDNEIEKYREELTCHSDYVADHPEISGEEYETSKKIVNLLKEHGYECEYPFDNIDTAFRAIYGENNHKYKIALLAEYDALPGIGHACGHALSSSISMLAGLALRPLQEELNADIHIIGTPSEETDGKKVQMVADGVFDNYDYAIMVHLNNSNLIAPNCQCLIGRYYEFHGKSAHASAAPWEGRNALNAAQLFFHAIDMLRQHTKPDAQFHGIIHYGGDAPNIVPEKVVVEEYVRAMSKEYVEELQRLVDDCAKGACIATQTTYTKYQKDADFYNLKPNPTGVEALGDVYEELGLEVNGDVDGIFGSADAGNVSFVCPAFHPCLQISDFDTPIHTRGFADAVKSERGHQGLPMGAKIIAHTIAKIFSDEEKIKKMKEDFERN